MKLPMQPELEGVSIIGLFLFGWDIVNDKPVGLMADDAWCELTEAQEAQVFKHIAETALDFAPLTMPDNFEESFWNGLDRGQ